MQEKQPKRLHIDIETYSPEPIADTGNYKYAMSPDFQILLCAYAYENEPVACFDLASGETLPDWFIKALQSPEIVKYAHNAVFERVCFTMHLRRLGILGPQEWLDARQWRCSMVQCSRCGLPLSLDQAGAALGIDAQKMKEGKQLIQLFCTPHENKGGMFGQSSRVKPSDQPEKWAIFKAYCIRDVEAEREISDRIEWYPVSDFEQELYAIDQQINDRGVLIDSKLVQNAIDIDATYKARLNVEAVHLTGLSNPNSVNQLKGWITEQTGIQLDSLSKTDIPDLRSKTTDQRVLRVLQIRAEMGKTSCKKYEAMQKVAGPDSRARGVTQFYGSRTGRWAGRLIQMQNLPQNHITDLDFARQSLLDKDADLMELCYGNVPDVLSQLIRTAFVAPKGKTLAVCDFSAIEARVTAWLAGEEWVLDVFRNGGDIYCETASQMFHVPVKKHGPNAELRQKGKISVLALGYGGGVGALDQMGGQRMGLTQDEEAEIVRKWRDANPHIVNLWKALENAAKEVCVTKGTRKVGPLTFAMHENTMTVQLPSGRLLSYPDACPTTNRFGSASIKYHGMNQETHKWVWLETYGGKITENIVQATARDCLAETMMTVTKELGLPIIFHVHDELIMEVDEDKADETMKAIKEAFAKVPAWAQGLPLSGAGYITPYYKKD